jgi:hypothetical protein
MRIGIMSCTNDNSDKEYDFSKAVRGPIDDPLTMLKLMMSVKYMDPRDRNTLENICKEVEDLRAQVKYWEDQEIHEAMECYLHTKDLEAALKDVLEYVDVDNMTMQHKYLKWIKVLQGGKWEPGNVEVDK